MIYLFQHHGSYYLQDVHPRKTHPGMELLGTFHQIQDALRYCEKMQLPVRNLLKKTWSGLTPEGREHIRHAKLGDKNPNFGGLSSEHKQKIAQTMKKRRGEHHHFYNQRHSPRSKLKISLGMKKLNKRRWCLDDQGNEHFVYLPFHLPTGWCWGRARLR